MATWGTAPRRPLEGGRRLRALAGGRMEAQEAWIERGLLRLALLARSRGSHHGCRRKAWDRPGSM
jgi:hypothetical protein